MTFFRSLIAAAAASLVLSGVALAAETTTIEIIDPYARSSTKMSVTGAAFMEIRNTGETDDRLIDVTSDVAERVELHTHVQDADGVMRMVHVETGFPIPAGAVHVLGRGGDHVMFLGLKQPLEDGDTIPLTLVFEKAGMVEIDVPVDLTRKPKHGMGHMNHGQKMPEN